MRQRNDLSSFHSITESYRFNAFTRMVKGISICVICRICGRIFLVKREKPVFIFVKREILYFFKVKREI